MIVKVLSVGAKDVSQPQGAAAGEAGGFIIVDKPFRAFILVGYH